MQLEKITDPKFDALPKSQLKYVLGGGTTETTPGGTFGLFPPYFKFTSDCNERNSKGQIYSSEFTKDDGTIFQYESPGVAKE